MFWEADTLQSHHVAERLGLLQETELAARDEAPAWCLPEELRVWAIVQAGCECHAHTTDRGCDHVEGTSPGQRPQPHEERVPGTPLP